MKKVCIRRYRKDSGAAVVCVQFIAAVLFLFLFMSAGLYAEEFRIVPKEVPDVPGGRIAVLQGNVDKKGDKFIVENLSILQPVEVTLLSKDPDADLTLQLCKLDWKKPERSGSTKGTGIQTFRIRTEGDLKIFVASSRGEVPGQLVVWVGDRIQPEMKPAFIPKEQYKGTKGGSPGAAAGLGSPVLWIIALLLAAILAVLIIFLKRGKKA